MFETCSAPYCVTLGQVHPFSVPWPSPLGGTPRTKEAAVCGGLALGERPERGLLGWAVQSLGGALLAGPSASWSLLPFNGKSPQGPAGAGCTALPGHGSPGAGH